MGRYFITRFYTVLSNRTVYDLVGVSVFMLTHAIQGPLALCAGLWWGEFPPSDISQCVGGRPTIARAWRPRGYDSDN